jgi:hypothetical protein
MRPALTETINILFIIINTGSTGTQYLKYTHNVQHSIYIMTYMYEHRGGSGIYTSLNCCKRFDPVTDMVMSI